MYRPRYRPRSSRDKSSLVSRLSLGLLVLGIGLIFLALINIRAQSVRSADVYRHPSSSTTVSTEPSGSSETPDPDRALYPKYPAQGDTIGVLSIPALGQSLPIIQGTDEDDLKRGVGHYTKSVLPGQTDNCVLSGHRDTVFRRLGNLEIGDRFVTQTSAGRFDYEIRRIRIVDKDDRTVIVPTDHAVLTVSTCYPFYYIGNAPRRYVLVADLVHRPSPHLIK
ncbi:MAG: class D sortase [Coriobacteriia bacterium]